MKDYYYILGISNNASLEEVKKAYRKLSLKFHPDQNNGDKFFEERFRDINEAYETLNNEQKRKEYDAILKAKTGAGGAHTAKPHAQQQRKPQATDKGKSFGFVKFLFIVLVIGAAIFIIKRPTEKKSTQQKLNEAYKVLMEEKQRTEAADKSSNEKTDSSLVVSVPQTTASFTRQLKTTMIRFCSYDTIANNWGKWTDEWSPTEIIHNLQQFDSSGLVFDVNFSFDNPPIYSRYSFAGYDTANDWFKYVASNGDMICIKGIQLSYLVSNGWPGFPVEIYYWSQRQRVALLFG